MLSLWLLLQEHWLYMEPIFSTEDIVMQMATEGALFKVYLKKIVLNAKFIM
jgi:hypothetical protein